ncbi:hypothetical protein [Staphylococcus equorum]|nr:hypothetical protein [Staphylococcus equorum]
MDKHQDNKTIVDLNEEKDIDSKKAFKDYKKEENGKMSRTLRSLYE